MRREEEGWRGRQRGRSRFLRAKESQRSSPKERTRRLTVDLEPGIDNSLLGTRHHACCTDGVVPGGGSSATEALEARSSGRVFQSELQKLGTSYRGTKRQKKPEHSLGPNRLANVLLPLTLLLNASSGLGLARDVLGETGLLSDLAHELGRFGEDEHVERVLEILRVDSRGGEGVLARDVLSR